MSSAHASQLFLFFRRESESLETFSPPARAVSNLSPRLFKKLIVVHVTPKSNPTTIVWAWIISGIDYSHLVPDAKSASGGMQRISSRRCVNAAVLALALGLSGCVIPRNPFPLSSAAGAPGPGPVALLPIGEADVRSYGGVPTNKVVRVTNRVLNSIASSKNNLIGPEMLARGDTASAQRAVRTALRTCPPRRNSRS